MSVDRAQHQGQPFQTIPQNGFKGSGAFHFKSPLLHKPNRAMFTLPLHTQSTAKQATSNFG